MKATSSKDSDWMNRGVILDASEGDQVELSKYLTSALTVTDKKSTVAGMWLELKSSGGSPYRLRSTGRGDDLLLEKNTDNGWESFLRVEARLVTDE